MCKSGLVSTGMANSKLLSFGSLVSTVCSPFVRDGFGKGHGWFLPLNGGLSSETTVFLHPVLTCGKLAQGIAGYFVGHPKIDGLK